MTIVKNLNGGNVCFESSVEFMDDEIREYLHQERSPCTEQEFFTAYEKEHLNKFGELWELSKDNPVY